MLDFAKQEIKYVTESCYLFLTVARISYPD